jgi:hypothetical protein
VGVGVGVEVGIGEIVGEAVNVGVGEEVAVRVNVGDDVGVNEITYCRALPIAYQANPTKAAMTNNPMPSWKKPRNIKKVDNERLKRITCGSLGKRNRASRLNLAA